MPRTFTVLSPDPLDTDLFLGCALPRCPDLTISLPRHQAVICFVQAHTPESPGLTVVQPFTVADRREIRRVYGVTPPADWEPLCVTTCLVDVDPVFDPFIEVIRDVAMMSDGIVAHAGQLLDPPDPWAWTRAQDGRWRPIAALFPAGSTIHAGQ